MTKKQNIIYSLIALLVIAAYSGFLVKNTIEEVDTREETLPYEKVEEPTQKTLKAPLPTEPPVAPTISEKVSQPTEENTQAPSETGFSPIMPVSGSIIQSFSSKPVFNSLARDWRSHTGIDISAKEAERVLAIEDGTVTKAYADALWGNVIEIDHGEYISIYKNLSTLIMVKEGDFVRKGEAISGIGQSSPVEGGAPHLHFELLSYGKYIDPMSILS